VKSSFGLQIGECCTERQQPHATIVIFEFQQSFVEVNVAESISVDTWSRESRRKDVENVDGH
jgi:hypothetical protein